MISQLNLTTSRNILKKKSLILPFNVENENKRQYSSKVEEPAELVPLFFNFPEDFENLDYTKIIALLKVIKEDDGLYVSEIYPSISYIDELPQFLTFLHIVTCGIGDFTENSNIVNNFELKCCVTVENPAFKQSKLLELF